jgi:histidinol phosphatase-like enzyme
VSGGARSPDGVEACFARAREILGIAIDAAYCPHGAGPPICWCRMPMPGLGVVFIRKHRLDPARSIHVGSGPLERAFAERLGFRHVEPGEIFDAAP